MLVEKGPTLLKAIQHTGRDLQAALLRQALSKPDHRTGRPSDSILGQGHFCRSGQGWWDALWQPCACSVPSFPASSQAHARRGTYGRR